jgi:predicted phage baseplate assembly protein
LIWHWNLELKKVITMTLPIPNLDDRRFDDLSAELQARLLRQLPELTQIAPGDPVHAFVDLFAWLTETVIYRANRIPERQRRAFLNLLQIPLRPARPASGIVCIDSHEVQLPPLLRSESALKAGQVTFSTVGELQATPLELRVLVKHELDVSVLTAEGISLAQLRHQYGVEPTAFRPLSLTPGRDPITTVGTADGYLYLALALNKPKLIAQRDKVLQQLTGTILNIGLAPQTEIDGDVATTLAPRRLQWDLAWWPDAAKPDEATYLPLEVVADSSQGGRRAGVARLRLPRSAAMLALPDAIDPQFAGFEETPPETPADLAPGQLLFWLRLRCADDDLELGYIGVNAIDVEGVGIARDLIVGSGSGQPDQSITLPHRDIDENTIELDVEELRQFVPWRLVSHFAGNGPDDRVFTLDPSSGAVRFGDGIRGMRPYANARIRAAYYRYGGGGSGNLPSDAIKEITGGGGKLKLRHEWPTRGGVDRESVAAAEQRIPAFLGHRDRAVTGDDFAQLALDNPLRPVARANAIPGFFPGASLTAVRRDIPGVVSLFILPPVDPAVGVAPRPTAGMIREVYEYLSARTLIGSELYVLSPQYQPVAVALSIEVTDPATEQQTFHAVEEALLHYLWPLPPYGPRGAGWPLKRAVEINELRTQAGRVNGVEAVNGLRLFYQDLNTKQWRELTSGQALPLTDYQLPQLMAVSIQPGEAQPTPPRGFGPGVTPTGGKRSVPVPVIPDIC